MIKNAEEIRVKHLRNWAYPAKIIPSILLAMEEYAGQFKQPTSDETYWINYGNDGAWLTAEEMKKDYQQLLESTEQQPPSEIVDKLVEVGNDLAELVQYYEKRSYRIGAAKKSNKAITDWQSALTAYHK